MIQKEKILLDYIIIILFDALKIKKNTNWPDMKIV